MTEYSVNSIFISVQSEGANTGIPAIFINLNGDKCLYGIDEIEYEEEKKISDCDIAETVKFLVGSKKIKWVLIVTGNEIPEDLDTLIYHLHIKGLSVALETDGLFYQGCFKNVDRLIVKPEMPLGFDKSKIDSGDDLVIRFTSKLTNAQLARGMIWGNFKHRYLRTDPDDNIELIKSCVKVASRFGYRVSFPLHRFLGVS